MRPIGILAMLTAMLVGLPLLGVITAGHPLDTYLEFPPKTHYVVHAPFSWVAFVICAVIVLAMVALPSAIRLKRTPEVVPRHKPAPARGFPWWGWLGLISCATAWTLAWTRFSWFDSLQPHTFPFLWLSYILVINAATYRRKGRCMLINSPVYFLALFPASAVFWWFFEYLNRFVQNWYYIGVEFGPWEYFLYATASFSTVLPAVLGTREWLNTRPWIGKGFSNLPDIRPSNPRLISLTVMSASGAGLFCIGLWPNYLFPLLWAAPLLLIVTIQALLGRAQIFSDLARGDWTIMVSSALAALVCGFFWEMWNYYSLAKWIYAVPFVDRFHLFEMPILGYAGYLPFGLECTVIAGLIHEFIHKGPSRKSERVPPDIRISGTVGEQRL